MAVVVPYGKQQFLDAAGTSLALGSVAFYVPGTTTPKDTWQDSAQTTLNANPVPLDASGTAIIFGSGDYRQIVSDANGNTIWDRVVHADDTPVVGLFTSASSLKIPTTINIVQTSGYSTVGIGAALYAATTNTGTTPYRFQTANGRWFEIVAQNGRLHVDAFGAKGDCPDFTNVTDQGVIAVGLAAATNDVAAFVAAAQRAQEIAFTSPGAGCEIVHGGGKWYRIGYSASNPAITLAANCSMTLVGGGGIQLDPTTAIDWSTLPAAPTNKARNIGCVGVGDAFTGLFDQPTGTNFNGFIFDNAPATFTNNNIFRDLVFRCDLRVNWRALSGTWRLNGINCHYSTNTLVDNCYFKGTPSDGCSLFGGFNRKILNCKADYVGHGGQNGTSKNGVSMYGTAFKNNPLLSSHDDFVDNVATNFGRDAGVAYGNIKNGSISNIYSTGDQDRAIEGVAETTLTQATFGSPLPFGTIVHDVVQDGLFAVATATTNVAIGQTVVTVSDAYYINKTDVSTPRYLRIGGNFYVVSSVDYVNNTVTLGSALTTAVSIGDTFYTLARCSVTPETSNQSVCDVHDVIASNIGAGLNVFSFHQNNDGTITYRNITLKDCTYLATNLAAIFASSANASASNIVLLNNVGFSDGTTNAFNFLNAEINSDIDGATIDAGFGQIAKISNLTGQPSNRISIRNVVASGTMSSAFQLDIRSNCTLVDIENNTVDGMNSSASLGAALVVTSASSFAATKMRIRNNSYSAINPIRRTMLSNSAPAAGAIGTLIIDGNDCGLNASGQLSSFIGGSYLPWANASYDNSGGAATNFYDDHNRLLGQQKVRASAVPTTGTWGQGDTIDNIGPAAAGVPGWVCTTPGTFGAIGSGTTASTTSGSRTATFADTTGLVSGSFVNVTGLSPSLKRIYSVSGLTVTFTDNASATLTGAAVSNQAPVMKAMASLAA
jgi:hypothetical protein